MLPPSFHLSLLLLFLLLAGAEARTFVSLAGTLLEGEIVAVAGDNVTLKKAADGQTVTVNQNSLCKEDRAYIARWVEAGSIPGPLPTDADASTKAGASTDAGSAPQK